MIEDIHTTDELLDYLKEVISKDLNKSRNKQREFNSIAKMYKEFSKVNGYGFSEKEFVSTYYAASMELYFENK